MSLNATKTVPQPRGARVALALQPGQLIEEYTIEQTLGGGGFGITYLARDANLRLTVAIKEYFPADMAYRSENGSVQARGEATLETFNWGLARFIEEARTVAACRHPNIVRVLRYFVANGTAYIVMEYESGHSLQQWVPQHSPMDQDSLLKLVVPLLDGLDMVHAAGFLHRDIKPGNIYVRADASPVLIDFGSARRTTSGHDMTAIVSPGFAPFEQYHSQGNQGPWTDLYSLAAVMYWLVSGLKPMDAASRQKRDTMVPAVQCGRADVFGMHILRAIDWALTPDEAERPQTVDAFRKLLVHDPQATVTAVDPIRTQVAPRPTTALRSQPVASKGMTSSMPLGNFVCSVLFLDIVAYSKESVGKQYAIKSGFNELIVGKLARIPASQRIALDTGDGAGICFLGDPEEVLATALDIQRSLAQIAPMKVRMGLHLGPVRILNDMNGHANVVGDGINAAQRVMGFAHENALLVSKAFYDVVTCLADGGASAFIHVGAQTDKHGRRHDLYEAVTQVPVATSAGALHQGTSSVPVDQTMAPEELAAVERELTQHLGPLAAILMRKARHKAATVQALRDLLAPSIGDQEQQEAFRHGQAHPPSATRGAVPANSNSVTHSHSVVPSAVSTRPWLTQEMATQVEILLSQVVGPVARVLVKKEIPKSTDWAGLCQALAHHIDDLPSHKQFLTAMGRLR